MHVHGCGLGLGLYTLWITSKLIASAHNVGREEGGGRMEDGGGRREEGGGRRLTAGLTSRLSVPPRQSSDSPGPAGPPSVMRFPHNELHTYL